MFNDIKYILTDIEGTTTSVSFVFDELFPYFRNNISELNDLTQNLEVQEAFEEVKKIVFKEEGLKITSDDQVLQKLLDWSNADRKITPLKTLQGILWKTGYVKGILKGHVYDDVPIVLKEWDKKGLKMAVFSSGSVSAQKLIFGYSTKGDLTKFFSFYFDTSTGTKRESKTYSKIASAIGVLPNQVLFLSDIIQELEAASEVGMKTIQILRKGTVKGWENTAYDFVEVNKFLG